MKIAVDCRMIGMGGIGAYLDNILFFLLSNDKVNSYLLVGDKVKLELYSHFPCCQILHTNIKIFSPKEIFLFPVNQINQCDLFYSPNFNIPWRIKIPIYSTIHDVVFLDVNGLTSTFGKLLRWFFLWRTIKISAMIFTVSNFSKERILYHFKTKKNIIVTYNSILHNLNDFHSSSKSPFDFEYILFVGNIKKHKGITNLLEAYDKARTIGYQQKLVIVGKNDNFRTVDNKIINTIINKNKYKNNIIFTGRITDDQLYNIMVHATLLVQPSIYEGFGIPPMEALYLGSNVLLSDIPVFREIYDKLPVTFFNVNDVNDLKNKIILCSQTAPLNIDIRKKINKLYSLEKTAQLILNNIENL